MKKILVTGGAGFIGGYIVQELLNCGWDVVSVDNHSKYGAISHSFELHPNYRFVKGDVRDAELMFNLMKDVDHVIAGAALIGGISYFHTYAYDLLAENERIIASTCDAAIKCLKVNSPLKKVTYLSSSMVFESTTHWPSSEGDQRLIPPPFSSYGFQKLAVEYFALAAWQQYKLPYTIIRPFNCVGIGERRALGEFQIMSGNVALAMSHVVPDLIQKILKGQDPVRILGDGLQIRHYTYGGDLAKGIVSSLLSEKAFNEDFNISTSIGTNVIELAQKIWQKIQPEKEFRYVCENGFDHDVKKRVPSVEKARELLGFEAHTTLDEMLDEVIPWIKQAIKDGLI